MSRSKLSRFIEMATFENVIQPELNELMQGKIFLKGKWNETFFKNDNPIILELGCGKGEYTIELAKSYPEKNFIGIDIKGARMYIGAKNALDEKLKNVLFLRTRIEFIDLLFDSNEVDEIWLTFPDPQPKKRWTKKRLTSAIFLNKYRNILKKNALLHLKTDNTFLYNYTLELLKSNSINILHSIIDVHATDSKIPELNIITYYERQFIDQGKKIYYLCWENTKKEITELDNEKFEEIKKFHHRSVV